MAIICPMHGAFEQRPNGHLNGYGCPECANINRSETQRLTKDTFVQRSNNIHNNKYDYSLVEYITNSVKVKITCSIHGVFVQTPNKHMNGQGCPKCGFISTRVKRTKSEEQFIIDAWCKHGDKYNYSLVEYLMIT